MASGESAASGKALTIQGVRLLFPFKPYAAQIQVMAGVLTALTKVCVATVTKHRFLLSPSLSFTPHTLYPLSPLSPTPLPSPVTR